MNSVAVKKFDDFNLLDEKLAKLWEHFYRDGKMPSRQRSVISSSWKRCRQYQIDLLKEQVDVVYQGEQLHEVKELNRLLLKVAEPYMDQLFYHFHDDPYSVVLTDQTGVILDAKVNQQILNLAEWYRFCSGADWSEKSAGTNAIGTAIEERKPVQTFAAEHFCKGWHDWICSAAPIRDPFSRQLIGVLDMTARKNLVPAHDLYLVVSYAYKIERALASQLVEENMSSIQTLLDTIHEPLVMFDLAGQITRCNQQARLMLNLRIGDSLFDQFQFLQKEWAQCSDKEMKELLDAKDGSRWVVQVQPYRAGNRLLGGIALFRRQSKPKRPGQTTPVRYQFNQLLTRNPQMLAVVELAKKAAFSGQNVLIMGETGTGKEVLAQSIHVYGPRSQFPFVAINCGAIPPHLIASELFRYEEGAFTGAKTGGNKGKFLQADQGTIFLDEIGELPLEAQVYLLRVLEDRQVVPIGGSKAIPIDVRVIAATNRNLWAEVQKGRFRADLYYRLNVITLQLPPLRERKEDILLLAEHFLDTVSSTEDRPVLTEEACLILEAYSWPGNVRQLKNAVEQAAFRTGTGRIGAQELPSEIRSAFPFPNDKMEDLKRWRRKRLDKDTLLSALKYNQGNISETARMLSVSRMTIYRKLEEYGIEI